MATMWNRFFFQRIVLIRSTICCFSSNTKQLKKYKHRRNPKISDFNVNEILYAKTVAVESANVKGAGDKDAVSKVVQGTSSDTWFHSKERLKSLKNTEKTIGAVAIVTMLLGYFGIKWMVSVVPSKHTDPKMDESENEQPTLPQPAS